jgi:hypothetical protein
MHARWSIQGPRPLTQVMSTSIYQLALMANLMEEAIALATISAFFIRVISCGSRAPWSTSAHQYPDRLSHTRACNMPRIRGRSRRGAAWYAAQSRRKRKETFERAIAMATRRRRQRHRRPPREFDEEKTPAAGSDTQLEHTLFDAHANWHPCMTFGLAGPSQPAEDFPEEERPYTPCYVVEELPPEFTRAAEVRNDQNEKEATTEERADTNCPEQHNSVDWDLLSLLFEIRKLLDDQVFRMARLEQRLDMFYAAHSRAAPKKQC